jgi:alpha-ketoglutarate-dependent taurine dioxygenase
MHNELSYTNNSPKFVFFFCVEPPQKGGETVLGDSSLIYKKLSPELISKLNQRGVKYSRFFLHEDNLPKSNEGISKSWQLSFNSNSKENVERICKEIGYTSVDWDQNNNLEIKTKSFPIIRNHPETNEIVWFNQIQGWDPRIALMMKNIPNKDDSKEYSWKELYFDYPQGCYYGDNDEIIDLNELKEINKVTWEDVVDVKWKSGDFLWIDNFQTCHGKRPHEGKRNILASLAN